MKGHEDRPKFLLSEEVLHAARNLSAVAARLSVEAGGLGTGGFAYPVDATYVRHYMDALREAEVDFLVAMTEHDLKQKAEVEAEE